MIPSTTFLFKKDKNDSPGTRQLDREENSQESQKIRRETAVHYACMQAWFFRSSRLEKLNYIKILLSQLKTIPTLQLIINALSATLAKSKTYSKSLVTNNSIYEKGLKDHNRSLHEATLKKIMDTDLKWFNSLNDSYQIMIIIGLVRCGGGYLWNEAYEESVVCCQKLTEQTEIDLEIDKDKPKEDVTENADADGLYSIYEPQFNVSVPKFAPSRFSSFISESARLRIDLPESVFEKYDKESPAYLEMQSRRNEWESMISKYKKQVETDRNNRTKNTNNVKQKGAQKKIAKKSKGNDKIEDLDMIQLLPVWVVYKIFNYLDKKTLNKIKTVNSYWNYVVNELLKGQQIRKSLDKLINQLEVEAEKYRPEILFEHLPEPNRVPYEGDMPKKNLLKLAERGAVIPQIRGYEMNDKNMRSLITEAVQETPECYQMPVSCLSVFPRHFKESSNSTICKAPANVANELGIHKTEKDSTLSHSSDL